jgi:cytochrome P450 family 628
MFVPFSIGKRSCIGQNLALMELRVIIANILRNFDVALVGGEPELDYFVTLKPVELRLKINKRSR